jgi:hypothetical protein
LPRFADTLSNLNNFFCLKGAVNIVLEEIITTSFSNGNRAHKRAISAIARIAASDQDSTARKAAKSLLNHLNDQDKSALLDVAWRYMLTM